MTNSKEFLIDKTKCVRCGKCIDVCPEGIIKLSFDKKVIDYINNPEVFCNKCGHCIAVCKAKAIRVAGVKNNNLISASENRNNCGDIVENLIKNRRSIRKYKTQKIQSNEIKKLIDTAGFAPSGSNAHHVEWIVYSDDEKIREIARLIVGWMSSHLKNNSETLSTRYKEIFNKFINDWKEGRDLILRDAPHFIIAHGPSTGSIGTLNHVDGHIALDYFELAAIAAGFGTCCIGLFYHAVENLYQPLLDYLALPEGHVCYGAMILGYPKYKYTYIPERKEAKIIYR
jgi:nitroreductase/Pyruvate/2-oxoacid:ferredoxin oxidoreductase delta subunit